MATPFPFGKENSAQSFSGRSLWKSLRVVDVRAFGSWMSAPKSLFFSRTWSALTEVLGRDIHANDPRMSAGYPSQKLPLWADLLFLIYRGTPKSSKNKKNILRTFPLVRNFSLKVAADFLEHFWCLCKKDVAIHAYPSLGARVKRFMFLGFWRHRQKESLCAFLFPDRTVRLGSRRRTKEFFISPAPPENFEEGKSAKDLSRTS